MPKKLSKIFLSASIPAPDRDPIFFGTADITAIRDAVRALATIVVPNATLIWGGHPSITPLIRLITRRMKINLKSHVTLYQSKYFQALFPLDNNHFENIKLTVSKKDQDSSLMEMRIAMIIKNDFKAGVFIGGMEGVLLEYNIFRKAHPDAVVLPIASTGAAAKLIFQDHKPALSKRLLNDYAYMSLFSDLINPII